MSQSADAAAAPPPLAQVIRQQSVSELKSSEPFLTEKLTVVVFGASGDLAKKKTYPSLYALYHGEMLPVDTVILGYARTEMTDDKFRSVIEPFLLGKNPTAERKSAVQGFLKLCVYRSGQYDKPEDVGRATADLANLHDSSSKLVENRVFYLALPPNQFASTVGSVKLAGLSTSGFNRFVVEKPFGRDTESARALGKSLEALFSEDHLYRIDHYLGKELVQNLVVLRFANAFLEPLWNRTYVSAVQISFKEDIGTQGRGGYFDESGIIRDVIQNHLMQVMSIVSMESPIRVSGGDYANFVRDEKVKVLRACRPVKREDVVLGQYVTNGVEPGYLDDPTVPKGSKTPTFATYVDNQRWAGVPFIIKAGKGLDDRRAEIRVQFKPPPAAASMFGGQPTPQNELVIRLQPQEAIYMKTNVKKPGLHTVPVQSELDLTYEARYPITELHDAYTRLLLDVLRGKQATFVRNDEVIAAWEIFTPLLKEIEAGKIESIPYKFGTRGPAESDALIAKVGFVYSPEYASDWQKSKGVKL